MSLSDLFKSNKEKEREKQRAARRAERNVERSLEDIQEQIRELQKKGTAYWWQAREKLAKGDKSGAQQRLLQFKQVNMQIKQLESHISLGQNKATAIAIGQKTKDLANSLGGYAQTADLDPETVVDNIDTLDEATDNVDAITNELLRSARKDQAKILASEQEESLHLEDDPLWAELEQEAAVGIAGTKQAATGFGNTPSVDDISEGEKRLAALLDK